MTDTPPAPDLPPLDSEPEERRLFRAWHLALLSIFVAYPLSVGPVAWACKTFDPDTKITGFVHTLYIPLGMLYDAIPPVTWFYDWYLGLFGVK